MSYHATLRSAIGLAALTIRSVATLGGSPPPDPDPPPGNYDELVEEIGGADVVLYLKCATAAALVDDGPFNLDGTFTGGSPTLIAGLITDPTDSALAFGGAVVGQIAHDTELALSAFTLSFRFRLHSLAAGGVNTVILAKDQTGLFAGDFAVFAHSTGLTAQFQSGSGSFVVGTDAFQLGVNYHCAVTADGSGFALWLDGQKVAESVGFLGAWSANTQALQFAKAPWTADIAVMDLDAVVIFGRVCTSQEIVALAQIGAGANPVLTDIASTVPESATTPITLLPAVSSATGDPGTDFTFQIVNANGNTVAIDGTDLDFTAGSVGADTATFVDVRLLDLFGTSNTARVSVTVLDSSAPPPPSEFAPICYVVPGAQEPVSTMAALETAIENADPGDDIRIAAGTYTGGTRTITRSGGSASNPVIVRPAGARGSVTINNPIWTLSGGIGLVMESLFFNNGLIIVDGGATFTRLSRLRFRQVDSHSIRLNACVDTRVDHCDFSDWLNTANGKACVAFASHPDVCHRILIDYCYIHDFNPTAGNNSAGMIGRSGATGAFQDDHEFVIDHCLFQNASNTGDLEIIGAKMSFGKIQFSTFENCPSSYINLPRCGHSWEMRSCWFEGGRNPTFHTGSDNPVIIGNRFIGGKHLDIFAGTTTYPEQVAAPSTTNLRPAARFGQIVGNVLDTGFIRVGSYWSSGDPPIAAVNNTLRGNIRNGAAATTSNGVTLVASKQTGTVITADLGAYAGTFVLATKLTPAMVGLDAPDPLCP